MIFNFTFPTPPTLNQQITDARSNKYKSAAVKAQWTDHIAASALAQYKEQQNKQEVAPLTTVKLEFFWHYININSDADNLAGAAKYLMDGLVKGGILTDDSLKYIQSPVIHNYTKLEKNPRKPKAKLQPYVVLRVEEIF